MLGRLRKSFAAKIMLALLGTVAVLSGLTFAVVRVETQRQVRDVVARTAANAAMQFRELEALQRQQVARVARPLTEGRRTLAALDEAITAGDEELLAGLAQYELDLAELHDVLVAFTDGRGRPILTLYNGHPMEGDPAGVAALAMEALEADDGETLGYSVVDGVLHSVRAHRIELARRAIGTLSLGLPVTEAELSRIGSVLGVEVCVVVAGSCVVATDGISGLPQEAIAGLGGNDGERVEVAGASWALEAQPLLEDDADQGVRVIAVPLDPVVGPFRRISRALLVGGLAALLLAVGLGLVLAQGLVRPVRALVDATGRVGEGDFDAEVEVSSEDEIGVLAGAFNDMTRGLRLKERYRSVLNKVVSTEVAEELMEGGVELGGENRRVAVLFADIRGFSTLTEGMEPQEVIGLLNECMQRLSDAVEAEGGVVDKYVGDELMALFGAPLSREDDALRAVRAALRMQASMAELNRERAGRGDAPIGLGVGINTGVAVAGNMGSANRLNYTVLGDMVNLASRLCNGAAAGEILITDGLRGELGDGVETRPAGTREFKGFSRDMEVHTVHAIRDASAGRGETPRLGVVLLLAGAALAQPLAAQDDWPTLADAGISYMSPSGAVQIDLSGRADLELFSVSGERSGLAAGEGTWVAPRVRLFTDVFLGSSLYGLVEVRTDRGPGPERGDQEIRVEQAFLRFIAGSGGFAVQAGRFASPFGSYAPRHFTAIDPFVRPPLHYDYRTMVCAGIVPATAAAFIGWKDDPAKFRPKGSPPIWGVPYQWGAMVLGTVGPLTYRLAAMNSTPSSPPAQWGWNADRFEDPSWVAGLTARVNPSLTLGASWSRGPYLKDHWEGALPPGDDGQPSGRGDFPQQLVAMDASFARGPLMVRGEVLYDWWKVPNVEEGAAEWGYSLEAQSDLRAGFFVAGRVGLLDFRPLADGLGNRTDWDDDVARYEAGLGYRLARNAGVLLSASVTDQVGELDADDDLLAVRLWWAF